MKAILTFVAWAVLAAIILYAAVNPETGIVFQSPGAAICVAVIGLGLCKHAHDRQRVEESGE